jgi:hypothetical protein
MPRTISFPAAPCTICVSLPVSVPCSIAIPVGVLFTVPALDPIRVRTSVSLPIPIPIPIPDPVPVPLPASVPVSLPIPVPIAATKSRHVIPSPPTPSLASRGPTSVNIPHNSARST